MAPYFDDLLVYSPDDQSHVGHLRKVLAKLQSAHLYAKPSKCVFAVKEVEYLGFLVSAEGIRSDPSKVAAIGEMPAPTDASGLKSFLGMIVYFSRFIRNHAALALVLTDLTKKGVPFVWTSDHQKAFEELKMALTKTPVLRPFDSRHEIVVQTDASDRAVGAVLLQRPPSGALRPVAFLSRKFSGGVQVPSPGEGSRRDCLCFQEMGALLVGSRVQAGDGSPVFDSCEVFGQAVTEIDPLAGLPGIVPLRPRVSPRGH